MPALFSEEGQHSLKPRHEFSVLEASTGMVSSSGIISQHPCYFRVMDPFFYGLASLTTQTLKFDPAVFSWGQARQGGCQVACTEPCGF